MQYAIMMKCRDDETEGWARSLIGIPSFNGPGRLWYGAAASITAFLLALWIGIASRPLWSTLSLIGTSILLEAQPGAAGSVALGFPPLSGAVVSILSNLIPIPILFLSFDQILRRWRWARQKVQHAERWSHKYRRYGVGALVFLSPFLGAYVCIGIGIGMGWKPWATFCSVLAGMLGSVLFIVYGGHWLLHVFTH